MITEQGFLQSIKEHPQDWAYKLVFADWLEEQGREQEAELIRIENALWLLPKPLPIVQVYKIKAMHKTDYDERLGFVYDLHFSCSAPVGSLNDIRKAVENKGRAALTDGVTTIYGAIGDYTFRSVRNRHWFNRIDLEVVPIPLQEQEIETNNRREQLQQRQAYLLGQLKGKKLPWS